MRRRPRGGPITPYCWIFGKFLSKNNPACGTLHPSTRLSGVGQPPPAVPHSYPVSPRCPLLQRSSILVPGDTVWRRCKAGRFAILNDAAAYFAALREALLLATSHVYIIG